MPLKLSVSVSRKVGQPDFGALGASCGLELELSQELLHSDPDALRRRVRDAYLTCQEAVRDELARLQRAPECPPSDGHAAPSDDPLPDLVPRMRNDTPQGR